MTSETELSHFLRISYLLFIIKVKLVIGNKINSHLSSRKWAIATTKHCQLIFGQCFMTFQTVLIHISSFNFTRYFIILNRGITLLLMDAA